MDTIWIVHWLDSWLGHDFWYNWELNESLCHSLGHKLPESTWRLRESQCFEEATQVNGLPDPQEVGVLLSGLVVKVELKWRWSQLKNARAARLHNCRVIQRYMDKNLKSFYIYNLYNIHVRHVIHHPSLLNWQCLHAWFQAALSSGSVKPPGLNHSFNHDQIIPGFHWVHDDPSLCHTLFRGDWGDNKIL